MSLVSAGRAVGLGVILTGSALFLACGGGGASETKSSTAPTSSSPAASSGASSAPAASGDLSAALSEWAVKPSSASTKAGKVALKVTNSGTTPHELVVIKTDVAHDKLEQAAGIVDETKYKPLVRSKQLNGAESQELAAELTAGKYVLLCNVAGHYGLGMHTAFTVN